MFDSLFQKEDVWTKEYDNILTVEIKELIEERKKLAASESNHTINKISKIVPDIPVKGEQFGSWFGIPSYITAPIGPTIGFFHKAGIKAGLIGRDVDSIDKAIGQRMDLLAKVRRLPTTPENCVNCRKQNKTNPAA